MKKDFPIKRDASLDRVCPEKFDPHPFCEEKAKGGFNGMSKTTLPSSIFVYQRTETPSQKVAEKMGMRHDQYFEPNGEKQIIQVAIKES